MTTILYIVLAIVIIIAVLVIIAPKNYDVNRSITINQSVSTVFDYLKYLKNQDQWSPWNKKDPNMKSDYQGIDGTIGFIGSWSGNKDVGVGEQEITGLVENQRIETALRFKEPFENNGVAIF